MKYFDILIIVGNQPNLFFQLFKRSERDIRMIVVINNFRILEDK